MLFTGKFMSIQAAKIYFERRDGLRGGLPVWGLESYKLLVINFPVFITYLL